MQFMVLTSMTTRRVVGLDLRSDCFPDERFLTTIAAAFQSGKYRIDVVYADGDKNVELSMASNDENGEPHFGDPC
jgi:hypothetical protein